MIMVETTIPEIMVMLMSLIISAAPSARPKAMGTRARMVVRVVINTGRIRRGQAWRMASTRLSPCSRRWRM